MPITVVNFIIAFANGFMYTKDFMVLDVYLMPTDFRSQSPEKSLMCQGGEKPFF